MTVPTAPQPRDGEPAQAAVDLRQGDVVEVVELPLVTGVKVCEWDPTPHGVVILSQTCDLVRPDPLFVTVAPLVELAADEVRSARKGRQPSLVHVTDLGDSWFVDLRRVASVSKEWLTTQPRQHGVSTDRDISEFGKLVGRKFSRFAFPDEVVYWLKPLQEVAASKYDNPASAEGRLFNQVRELRVKVDRSWSYPFALTLVVILEPGELPTFPNDDLPDITSSLTAWLRPNGVLRPPGEIAERLDASDDPIERYWLWQALGEAWSLKCRPKRGDLRSESEDKRLRIENAIQGGELGYEVMTTDDFSMTNYLNSEMLDLDHLSPVVPLIPSSSQPSGETQIESAIAGDGSSHQTPSGWWRPSTWARFFQR